MKKNFFKKLASGLALAMVVTSFAPAAPAFAAAATKIVEQGGKKAPQTVYVGKKVDYSLNNVYKTNTYKWFTSNAKIAKITQTGGIVTPVAPCKATIKVNAYKKSTGKLIKAFKLDLDVKLRATSVNIGAEDFELAVGEKKDLDAVKTPANSTDTLRYFSSDEKVATVDTKTGIVTAVAAGEATIKVASKGAWFTANNSKYNKYDEVKVTVVDGLLSVKQTAANKLSLTFSKDVSKTLKVSDFALEDVVNHSIQAVKGLSFSKDGKVATLETYLSFTDKREYKLSYDKKDYNFTASVGEVASIALKTDKVVFNEETAIKYALYDANGIDITSVVDDSRVVVESEIKNGNGYTTDNGKKITLFNKGDNAEVTVTYHTYKYENGAEVTVSVKGTIVAVDVLEGELGNYEAYTIAKSEPNWNKLTPVTRIAVGDGDEYDIFLRVKDAADKYIAQKDITYKSSNADVLLVSEDGSLYPVKVGTAYVIATAGKTSWTLPVTVVEERKAATIAVDKPSVSVSNTDKIDDKATVTITVRDQYGDVFNSDITTANVTPGTTGNYPLAEVNGNSVTFNGNSCTKGSYSYIITSHGKNIPVRVNVLAPSNDTAVNKLVVSTNVVDMKIDENTILANKAVDIVVGSYKGGVLYDHVPATIKVTNPDGDVVATTAVTGTAIVKFNPYQTVTGSAIEKVKTGTYKVTTKIGNENYEAYIRVNDSQVLPTFSLDKLTTAFADVTSAAQDTLVIRNADGKKLPIESATGKVVGNQINIDAVTVFDIIATKNGDVKVKTTIKVGRTVYTK